MKKVILFFLVIISSYSFATTVGQVVGWGDNTDGQSDSPLGIEYYGIAAGNFHNLALSNGTVYGWGWNSSGQTDAPSGTNFVMVTAGLEHSIGLKADGTLAGWGKNNFGQTDVPEGSNYVAISAGGDHTLALRDDGSVVGWGDNIYGQSESPTGYLYVAIAAGSYHSLALRSDGTIVAWGDNAYGQCDVPAFDDYAVISAGNAHSVAIRRNGSLIAWGDNVDGQCDVPTGNNYFQLDAGSFHNVALKNDGSIIAWGDNFYGQTNTLPGSDYYAVSAGDSHCIALRPPALACQFSVNARRGLYFLDAEFNSVISGTNTVDVYYEWDFNDDGVPDAQGIELRRPTYTYTSGTYSVRLTVTNTVGEIAEFYQKDYITIFDQGVKADFAANSVSGIAPFHVQFENRSENGPQYYSWDLDGDGIDDSNARDPVYVYNEGGTYSISLAVSNDFRPASSNSYDKITKVDYIHVVAPVIADFSVSPSLVITGQPVSFVDMSTNNPEYWFWDFDNDGITDTTDRNPSYTYITPGYKTVSLTASNALSYSLMIKTNCVAVTDMTPPHIVSNVLLFPAQGSEVTEMVMTNIIWNPAAIEDDLGGEALTISLLQVMNADNYAEITYTTNDIPVNIGAAPWESPFALAGVTNYVVSMEVVDITGLTGSYTFVENIFQIVPEPTFMLAGFLIIFIGMRRYSQR